MSQTMKAATAAAKLGIYLPAAPAEFQSGTFSRDDLDALRADPPAWLTDLRRNGPYPRDVVAAKLGVSRSALNRAGVSDAMTADEIGVLLADPPAWLLRERDNLRDAVAEERQRRDARA